MLTVKDVQSGALRGADEAANSSLQSQRDAKLKQLLQGRDQEHAAQQAQAQQEFQMAQLEAKQAEEQAKYQRDLETAQALRRQYGPQSSVDAGGVRIGAQDNTLGKQVARELMQANITGYDVANPGKVIPSSKDAEEVKLGTSAFKQMEKIGGALEGKLQDAGPLDRIGAFKIPFTNTQIGTAKGKSLESDATELMLQGKELAKLGALAGPDMDLMLKAQGGLTGIGSLFNKKEDSIAQLREVIERGRLKLAEQAKARGYAPQAGYLGQAKPAAKAPVSGGLTPEEAKELEELRKGMGR